MNHTKSIILIVGLLLSSAVCRAGGLSNEWVAIGGNELQGGRQKDIRVNFGGVVAMIGIQIARGIDPADGREYTSHGSCRVDVYDSSGNSVGAAYVPDPDSGKIIYIRPPSGVYTIRVAGQVEPQETVHIFTNYAKE